MAAGLWPVIFDDAGKKQAFGSRRTAIGNGILPVEYGLLIARYWMLDARFLSHAAGHWSLDAGCWMLDTGHWSLVAGYSIEEFIELIRPLYLMFCAFMSKNKIQNFNQLAPDLIWDFDIVIWNLFVIWCL
jgi:hypothetical protein